MGKGYGGVVMDARSEQLSLTECPLPATTQVQSLNLAKLPPLTRALECESEMIKIQTEIDRLAKLHISALNEQMQDLASMRQAAIQEAATAGIKRDDKAVLIEKTKSSPRKILATVLKEKDEELYNKVMLTQVAALEDEIDGLKNKTEVPIGVAEKCYKDLHGKGFDAAPIFEPVTTKIDYSVMSIEAKKIQDAIEASKKAKKKELL
jgi:hypothetical protein